MTIRTKLISGFGAMLLLIAVLAAVVLWGLRTIQSNAHTAQARNTQLASFRQAAVMVIGKYQVVADTIINRDVAAAQRDYAELVGRFDDIDDALDSYCDTPEERAWMAELDAANTALDELYTSKVVPEVTYQQREVLREADGKSDAIIEKAEQLAEKTRASLADEFAEAVASGDKAAIHKRAADLHVADTYVFYLVKQYQVQADAIINRDVATSTQRFAEAAAACKTYEDKLAAAVDTPEERKWIAECQALNAQFGQLFHEVVVPAVARANENRLSELDAEADALVAQMAERVDNIAASIAEEVVASQEAMDHAEATVFATTLTMAGVLFALGILTALYIASSVTRPIRKIVDRIRDIAEGEGDLTQRVDDARRDEIGELGKWFNAFVEKVHDIIFELDGSAREVVAATSQIASSSEEVSRGVAEQTQQVRQISSAVEEMSASVVEVAKKSADAAKNAEESGRLATEGGQIVQQTVTGMQTIDETVSASAAAVEELGKRGEEIGQIIEVINDIADQTNLLALNAAIEAARAGEHGRGFAVVADEVRKLADRTTNATEEIAASIKAIQTETGEAVSRMTRGTDEVRAGVEHAQQAGESLGHIVKSASDVSALVQAIAAAAEEQSAAGTQVATNIESISAASEQADQAVRQSATAAMQLSSKAEGLQAIVRRFKINAQAASVGG